MIELGKTFHGGAEWLCSSSLVSGLVRNPIFTALLITVITCIIIFALLSPKTSWRLRLKTGFWLLLATSLVVFVHYYALERDLKKRNAQTGVRTIVDSIHAAATTGGGYQVSPYFRDDIYDESDAESKRGEPSEAKINVTTPADDLILQTVVLPSTQAPGINPAFLQA